jgi:hypothetical protein
MRAKRGRDQLDALTVSEIQVGPGPTLKRWLPEPGDAPHRFASARAISESSCETHHRAQCRDVHRKGGYGGAESPSRWLSTGITKTWESIGLRDARYGEQLHEDIRIREFIKGSSSTQGSLASRLNARQSESRSTFTLHAPGLSLAAKGQKLTSLKPSSRR